MVPKVVTGLALASKARWATMTRHGTLSSPSCTSGSVYRQPKVDIPGRQHSLFAGQNRAPLQHVFEFADIARPVVGGQFGQSRRFHSLDRRLAAHLCQEVVDQQRQVLGMLCQRRGADQEDG